jgi:hypothetical protein
MNRSNGAITFHDVYAQVQTIAKLLGNIPQATIFNVPHFDCFPTRIDKQTRYLCYPTSNYLTNKKNIKTVSTYKKFAAYEILGVRSKEALLQAFVGP